MNSLPMHVAVDSSKMLVNAHSFSMHTKRQHLGSRATAKRCCPCQLHVHCDLGMVWMVWIVWMAELSVYQ
eukprot:23178-Chlamydomonas_euryale.AAC.1